MVFSPAPLWTAVAAATAFRSRNLSNPETQLQKADTGGRLALQPRDEALASRA
jgi:hypothetical protein